jgi:hypothetical protein
MNTAPMPRQRGGLLAPLCAQRDRHGVTARIDKL